MESLQPLPLDRKCFRMINGVLVERTVKDVIPSLKTNADGLKQVLDELMRQYKAKQDEMDGWKVCLLLCWIGLVDDRLDYSMLTAGAEEEPYTSCAAVRVE